VFTDTFTPLPFFSSSSPKRKIYANMRFSHLTVFALSGFAIANPIISKRATEDAVSSLLTDLYAQVQIYTGAISTFSLSPEHTHTRFNY
jgi:hypothetical protein